MSDFKAKMHQIRFLLGLRTSVIPVMVTVTITINLFDIFQLLLQLLIQLLLKVNTSDYI